MGPDDTNDGARLMLKARGSDTQMKAATELATDVATYWKYETGRMKPGRAMHLRIAGWARKRGVDIAADQWDQVGGKVVPETVETALPKRTRRRKVA